MTDTINHVAAAKKQEPAEPVLDEQGVDGQRVAEHKPAPGASIWWVRTGRRPG